MSPQLVADVIKNLSNGIQALAFFRWAERQEGFGYTAEGFHNLIEALGNIKQYGHMWNVVEAMRFRGLLSKDTFKIIVRKYAKRNFVKEAVEAFEKMSSFGVGETELSDYNWQIDVLCKCNRMKRAQAICKKMRKKGKIAPDAKTYTALMDGWGCKKDLPMVRTAYQEMLDAGVKPDVGAYGMLIRALCESGKCDEALEVFHEMEASGCMPNPRVYGMLINTLHWEDRLDEALKYAELYKESGLPMAAYACNAVVGAYCGASKFEDAFKMADEMRKCKIGPNVQTYMELIFYLIESENFEEAYSVFQRMGMDGCEPQLNIYRMMVFALCTKKRVDMALNVWKQMLEEAYVCFREMLDSGIFVPDYLVTKETLIRERRSENRLEEAYVCFREMLDSGISVPDFVFTSFKETLTREGRVSLAQELESR
ncbi:hypothetical protein U9M48_025501, partial [Paspalum notatum var. saurae]